MNPWILVIIVIVVLVVVFTSILVLFDASTG